MDTVRDTSGFVSNWVGTETDTTFHDGSMAFGFIDDGKLVGGIVLHDVRDTSCAIAIAVQTPRWCTQERLGEMFKVVFDELDKKFIYTLTPSRNTRALRLAKGLGFQQDGRMRKTADGGEDDTIVMGMTRQDCMFLE